MSNQLEALRFFRQNMEATIEHMLKTFPEASQIIDFDSYMDGVNDCVSVLESLEGK